MNPLFLSLIFAGCVFAGGVGGLVLSKRLPETHRSKEVQTFIQLATGMLSLLASLVLGLLIATARTTFVTMDTSVRTYAAELVQLDETLRDYGEPTGALRQLLGDYTKRLLERTWPAHGKSAAPFLLDDKDAGLMLEHLREAVRALRPTDNGQTWLQDQALTEISKVMEHRWQLIEGGGPGVQPAIIVILGAWIVVIFASFGLNVPRNGLVIAAFAVSALAIGSSIFLILELDSPFDGLLQISSRPIGIALKHIAETHP